VDRPPIHSIKETDIEAISQALPRPKVSKANERRSLAALQPIRERRSAQNWRRREIPLPAT